MILKSGKGVEMNEKKRGKDKVDRIKRREHTDPRKRIDKYTVIETVPPPPPIKKEDKKK